MAGGAQSGYEAGVVLRSFKRLVGGAALALVVVGCRAVSPTPGPEARCAHACEARAKACSASQCVHGCRISMDRLVEREGEHVLSCVAKAKVCDISVFADCASRAGPYLDGGPAPPGPAKDIDLADDGDS